MSFLINIPPFECYLRAEYCHNLESHHGEHYPVVVHAVDSVYGRAIGFHCYTDFGAMFARLPISAFCISPDVEPQPLDHLELWNNFSYNVSYQNLGFGRMDTLLRNGKWYEGRYMFTLAWYDSPHADNPGDNGFKLAHIIKLSTGNFAAQPNNRCRLFDPAFVTKLFPEKIEFKTNHIIWDVEGTGKWTTEECDNFFYGIQNLDESKEPVP